MAIPSVKLFSNNPGGSIVTAMGGINALNNSMYEAEYNKARAQYAPTSMMAEAASKLAYANLMGPQFLAKMLADEGIKGNLSEGQLANALSTTYRAGTGQGTGNAFLNMPGAQGLLAPQKRFSITDKLWDMFHKKIETPQAPTNALATPVMPQQQSTPNPMNAPVPSDNQGIANDNADMEKLFKLAEAWQQSPEGQAKIRETGDPNYMPDNPQEIIDWAQRQQAEQKTYAQKEAEYKGTTKQGEKSGEFRAEALRDIGHAQLALSGSGAAQDELIKIIKNPVWQNARNKIPAFQSQQLSVLKVTGSPELRKLAGEYTSAGQAMIASQVAGMGAKHLVREYDLAEKQKINDSDTIESSEGKITNAKNLHDIAVKKNNIIKDLLKKGVDEADAVEIANKKVDIRAIRRATDKLLERKVSVTNNKTGETKIMSVKEAQKLGVPNV